MNYVGATQCVVGECMFRQTSADGRYIGGRLFMTCTIVCTKWLTHQDLYFSVVYSMSVCGGLFGSFTMKMDKILLFYNKNWKRQKCCSRLCRQCSRSLNKLYELSMIYSLFADIMMGCLFSRSYYHTIGIPIISGVRRIDPTKK